MSGPLPAWCAPVTFPASIVWGAAVRLRNARLDRVSAWRAPRPVISVGNVAVGGTGKSPLVRWICGALRSEGIRPGVVLRGHRGGERADEVMEHRATLDDVPVSVGADRRAAIMRLLAERPDVQALVLDDGFQHRAVARDLDLVLVDATRPCLDDRLLPWGWLREPLSALHRADGVIVTRATAVDGGLADALERWHGRPVTAWTRFAWKSLRGFDRDQDHDAGIGTLAGRNVAIWAGIGNPAAFAMQARQAGATVVDMPSLRDHHGFSASNVADLMRRARRKGASAILCTEKDWMKLHSLIPADALPVLRPEVAVAFLEGERLLVDRLRERIRCWKPVADR
ncbi:MAG: tetraacyldisaccharide 4-kinase [Planctomycetota bacterium]